MTTAATGLASGDLGAALAANPFVLVLAGFTVAMAVLMAARVLGRLAPPGRWPESRRRQGYWVAGVLAAASWAFQLHRFGWV
jgi:NaMN:DMB phosphoribosyltransferase